MEELIVKEQETREKLVAVINESNLPAFVLEPIVKDLFEQISKLKAEQYETALQHKEEKKAKEEKENKEGKEEK